jgi:hypothetical protein
VVQVLRYIAVLRRIFLRTDYNKTMQNRWILLSFLVISSIGYFLGYFFLHSYDCAPSISCEYLSEKFLALYYGAGALAVVFAVLVVLNKAVFTWGRFAVWIVPMGASFLLLYHPNSWEPDARDVYRFFGTTYLIISFVLIAWNVLRRRVLNHTHKTKIIIPEYLRRIWYLYIVIVFIVTVLILLDQANPYF